MTTSAAASTAGFDLTDFIERYSAAWNGCDTDAMAELITEDIVWNDPLGILPEPGSRAEKMTAALQRLQVPFQP